MPLLKAILEIFISIFIIVVFSILGVLLNERHYQSKYNSTSLKISEEQFLEKWGEPDRKTRCSTNCRGDIKLSYNTIIGEYIFTFDEKSTLLVFKYAD